MPARRVQVSSGARKTSATPPPSAGRLPSEQTCLGHAYACRACFFALLGPVAFKALRVREFIPLPEALEKRRPSRQTIAWKWVKHWWGKGPDYVYFVKTVDSRNVMI